jgi:plasmid stabilization system protein ParE
MARVKFTAAARNDILSITTYSIETFGEAQAHLYQNEIRPRNLTSPITEYYDISYTL